MYSKKFEAHKIKSIHFVYFLIFLNKMSADLIGKQSHDWVVQMVSWLQQDVAGWHNVLNYFVMKITMTNLFGQAKRHSLQLGTLLQSVLLLHKSDNFCPKLQRWWLAVINQSINYPMWFTFCNTKQKYGYLANSCKHGNFANK